MLFTRRAILGAVCLTAAASMAQAQSTDYTGSITSIAPRLAMAGKLATRTEFLADRQEAAMVTAGSIRALTTCTAAIIYLFSAYATL